MGKNLYLERLMNLRIGFCCFCNVIRTLMNEVNGESNIIILFLFFSVNIILTTTGVFSWIYF